MMLALALRFSASMPATHHGRRTSFFIIMTAGAVALLLLLMCCSSVKDLNASRLIRQQGKCGKADQKPARNLKKSPFYSWLQKPRRSSAGARQRYGCVYPPGHILPPPGKDSMDVHQRRSSSLDDDEDDTRGDPLNDGSAAGPVRFVKVLSLPAGKSERKFAAKSTTLTDSGEENLDLKSHRQSPSLTGDGVSSFTGSSQTPSVARRGCSDSATQECSSVQQEDRGFENAGITEDERTEWYGVVKSPSQAPTGRDDLQAVLLAHARFQQSTLKNSKHRNLRAVIYTCREDQICGGLVDRLEGIITTYIWAVLSKRVFLIDYCKPGSLEQFYQPNTVDWSLASLSGDVVSRIRSSPHVVVRRHADDSLECEVLLRELRRLGSTPVIRITTNHARSCVVRLLRVEMKIANFSSDHLMALIFHKLFQWSSYLQSAVRVFANKFHFDPGSAVCLHIRHGGNDLIHGRTEKVRYASLDAFWKCAEQIKRTVLTNATNISVWFVASDAQFAVQEAMEQLPKIHNAPVHSTAPFGPLLHVDKYTTKTGLVEGRQRAGSRIMNNAQCKTSHHDEGELRVFLDHALLSMCRTFIGSRNSGFSLSAASLNANSKFFVVKQEAKRKLQPVANRHRRHRILPGDCFAYDTGGSW